MSEEKAVRTHIGKDGKPYTHDAGENCEHEGSCAEMDVTGKVEESA